MKDGRRYGEWLKRIVINKSLASIKRLMHFQEVALAIDIPEEEALPLAYSFTELQKVIQASSRVSASFFPHALDT